MVNKTAKYIEIHCPFADVFQKDTDKKNLLDSLKNQRRKTRLFIISSGFMAHGRLIRQLTHELCTKRKMMK